MYTQASQNGGHAANAMYNQGLQSALNTPVPRTIASAIGRVDGLNDRLTELAQRLANVSDQIGGPRPTGACAKDAAPSAGAVGRMHDSIERAYDRISEIEELAACISRALG